MTIALRVGLWLLAAFEIVLGLWTLLMPASFYADVPTVDLTPPYSEHLVRDFGGATLGVAVVLVAAAIWTDTRLVVISLIAYLAFAVPHLIFHLGHLHGATQTEAVLLVSGLVVMVAIPSALLVLSIVRARVTD